MTDINSLIQLLLSGDFLGFIQAVYLVSFQSLDVLWTMIILLFTTPLYIRTKSFLLLCMVWMMLGTFIMVAIPLVAGVAIFLWVLGVGGMLLKLFTNIKD